MDYINYIKVINLTVFTEETNKNPFYNWIKSCFSRLF